MPNLQKIKQRIVIYVSSCCFQLYSKCTKDYSKAVFSVLNLLTDDGNHVAQDYQDTRVRGLVPEPVDDFADGEGVFPILE